MMSAMKSVRKRACAGLRDVLVQQRPSVTIDAKGYVAARGDNLLVGVDPQDFEDDLRRAAGNELQCNIRAVHSSTALAVNCFAPFRLRIGDLVLPVPGRFQELRFKQRCPAGIGRAGPPHIDVLLSGPSGVVGIKSKLIEHLALQPSVDFPPPTTSRFVMGVGERATSSR